MELNMRTMVGLALLTVLVNGGAARADEPFLDEMARYFQRLDTISISAGDARDVNAVTHIIDPWPRYVGNRRIPANGERMVGAIQRYRNPRRAGAAQPTLAPVILPTAGASGSTSGGGGGGMGGYGGQ